MTLLEGRMRTWRLPVRSALQMLLRQSPRTETRTMLVVCVVLVWVSCRR